MTGDEPGRPSRGARACTRVSIVATIVHDGDRTALAGHLAAEVDAVCRSWGLDAIDLQTETEVVSVGDSLSSRLRTISCPHREDDQ